MNSLERKMIDQLFKLKEVYGVEGVKAEFEAEGTRTEELIRLRELTLFAGVTLTLKQKQPTRTSIRFLLNLPLIVWQESLLSVLICAFL